MKEVVIASACRTAIGSFGGSLKDIPVVDLGAKVIRGALEKVHLKPVTSEKIKDLGPDSLKNDKCEVEEKYYKWDDSYKEIQIDEVIMGNVVPAGQGQNTARQATVRAGLPKEVGAFTVNKVCASGMKAVALGFQAIQSGEAEVIIVGGMENMSQIPYAFPAGRWGARMFNSDMVDLMVHDGLWEIFYGYHMGVTAENIAEKYNISREEQDKLAFESHNRALNAIEKGYFKDEIIPVEIPQRKGDPIIFDTDERPMKTSLEKMAKLRPVFKKDGTVTAGNASGINDAAAALLLMTKEKAEELGLEPLAVIKGYAYGAIDPAYMGLGPIPAVRKLFQKLDLSMNDIDLIELNEAFASQAIGCTGARILVTLAYALKRNNLKRGLASLCIGGGMGAAMVIERN